MPCALSYTMIGKTGIHQSECSLNHVNIESWIRVIPIMVYNMAPDMIIGIDSDRIDPPYK